MRTTVFFALALGAAALSLQEKPAELKVKDADAASPSQKKKGKKNSEPAHRMDLTKEKAATLAHGKAVFYAVIMGTKYTKRHQVSLWLASLRLKAMGNWDGEAIIVTDKPKCLAKTLEETKMVGQRLRSNEFVDVYAPPPGMTGNLHVVKRPHTGNILKIKLEKARAWNNLANAGIPGRVALIVYTDEDIVMGKDVHGFVGEVSSYVPQNHTLALFRDTGKSRGELHTGVVVIYSSPHANTCLQAWGKKLTGLDIDEWRNDHATDAQNKAVSHGITDTAMSSGGVVTKEKNTWLDDLYNGIQGNAALSDSGALDKERSETDELDTDKEKGEGMEDYQEGVDSMGPDQQALGRTKECMADNGHQGIKILPHEYFWFPDPGGMTAGKKAEFIHFTNTGRWMEFSKHSIESYLTTIGVPAFVDPLGHSKDDACLISYATEAEEKKEHNFAQKAIAAPEKVAEKKQ